VGDIVLRILQLFGESKARIKGRVVHEKSFELKELRVLTKEERVNGSRK